MRVRLRSTPKTRYTWFMDDRSHIDEDLNEALAQVRRGEQVTLHHRGEPVAKLVPVDPVWDKKDALEAVEHMKTWRQGISLRGLRFKDLIHEGHKY